MNIKAALGHLNISKPPEVVFGSYTENEFKKEITVGIQKFELQKEFKTLVQLEVELNKLNTKDELIKMKCIVVVEITLNDDEVGAISEEEINQKIINEAWPIFESSATLLSRFKITPIEIPPLTTQGNV